jgi:hypothetical protein
MIRSIPHNEPNVGEQNHGESRIAKLVVDLDGLHAQHRHKLGRLRGDAKIDSMETNIHQLLETQKNNG